MVYLSFRTSLIPCSGNKICNLDSALNCKTDSLLLNTFSTEIIWCLYPNYHKFYSNYPQLLPLSCPNPFKSIHSLNWVGV